MTTLKRINQDSYAVLAHGVRVGTVSKGWSRTGGSGWTYSNERQGDGEISTVLTVPTRKAAVAALLNRIRHGSTNSVNHARRVACQ